MIVERCGKGVAERGDTGRRKGREGERIHWWEERLSRLARGRREDGGKNEEENEQVLVT